jgi:hypothetical protein
MKAMDKRKSPGGQQETNMTTKVTPQIEVIREQLEAALAKQGQALGYKFALGMLEYEPDGNFSIELLAVKNGNQDDEEKRYAEMAMLLPLPILHSVVLIERKFYEVRGLDENNKDVVLVRDNTRFLYSVRALSNLLLKGVLCE